MSAIAGCFWRDGRMAAHGDLRPALDAIRHRTPFALSSTVCGPVAFAAREVVSCGDYHIAFHGRLDNADEVRSRLGIERRLSNGGLALAAYRALGRHLMGFAIECGALDEPPKRRRAPC